VTELVRLLEEVCNASGKSPYRVWLDWLDTIAPWLAAIGQRGELQTTAQLPLAVTAIYQQVEARYEAAAGRYPSAPRVMNENFTQMFSIAKRFYPHLDLQAAVEQPANPDILGHAFLASLGWPARWGRFFPPWPACVKQAEHLAPGNPSQQIYSALAEGHSLATTALRRPIERPVPGGSPESWAAWLAQIMPYSQLPLVIEREITSPPLLLALAGRFSAWVTREMPLVQFEPTRLAGDPVLFKLAAISSMLSGLNGFYQQKNMADHSSLIDLEQALREAEQNSTLIPGLHQDPFDPDPSAVFRGSDDAGQEEWGVAE
jgi:hypothetical protein